MSGGNSAVKGESETRSYMFESCVERELHPWLEDREMVISGTANSGTGVTEAQQRRDARDDLH